MMRRTRRQGGGEVARRSFLHSIIAAPILGPLARIGPAQAQVRDPLRVHLSTLNHVSFGCADLPATVAWHEKVLGLPRHAFQDYAGGQTVLRVGNDPPAYMALSQQDPENVNVPPTRRPHFCWGVPDFDVHRILAALVEMHAPARSVLREGTTINGVNFEGQDGAPLQFNPEFACGGLGFLGEACDRSVDTVRRPADPPSVQVRTLIHIKYFVTDLQSSLEWYQRLTDMWIVAYQEPERGPRTSGYEGPPIPVLRVGSGPQHLALAEGAGPDAFRLHVGLGVEGFDPDRVMDTLGQHGVSADVRMREGITPEILVDAPDGVTIQLQDVTYCGGGGRLGNLC